MEREATVVPGEDKRGKRPAPPGQKAERRRLKENDTYHKLVYGYQINPAGLLTSRVCLFV